MNLFRNLLLAGAMAFAPIASASCQQIPPASASWADNSAIVPFELFRGNRVVAAGTINGQPVDFVLDTGAGITTVDRDYARSIGLSKGQVVSAQGVGGTVEAELVPDVSLTIGGLKLDKATVMVIDLANVSKGIGRPVPVVLGRELFDNAIVTLDWNASQMTVTRPDGFVPLPGRRWSSWVAAVTGSTPFRFRSMARRRSTPTSTSAAVRPSPCRNAIGNRSPRSPVCPLPIPKQAVSAECTAPGSSPSGRSPLPAKPSPRCRPI